MTVSDLAFTRALTGAQTGDNQAFRELWRIVSPGLRRYLQITAPRVVDDVSAATWVRVARGLRRASGAERDFRVLVVRIARDEAALRRRTAKRRPDSVFDAIELESARAAVRASRAALGADRLSANTAVGLLGRLPADVAEMVALRVVLGLDSADTGEIVGLRPGSVVVAVHSGLRRTSNLLGASARRAAADAPAAQSARAPDRPVGPPNPWALDRLLDLGPDGLTGLDPACAQWSSPSRHRADPVTRTSWPRRWSRSSAACTDPSACCPAVLLPLFAAPARRRPESAHRQGRSGGRGHGRAHRASGHRLLRPAARQRPGRSRRRRPTAGPTAPCQWPDGR